MSEYNKTFLCGGVFLLLLENAKIKNTSNREFAKGISDNHSNEIVLRDLLYVFTGSKNYSKKKDCSEYMNCKSEGSINVPFNDPAFIASFNSRISNEYPVVLTMMKGFIDMHIQKEKQLWLVKALLDVIEGDDDIKEDALFYCLEDGSLISKEQLILESTYNLDSFLLGVFHFITNKRNGRNTEGLTTIEAATRQRKNGRDYTGEFGNNINRIITIKRFDPSAIPTPKESVNNAEQVESVEAEYMGVDTSAVHSPNEGNTNITIIQNQTNIENNETNNFDIDNSTVTFNL